MICRKCFRFRLSQSFLLEASLTQTNTEPMSINHPYKFISQMQEHLEVLTAVCFSSRSAEEEAPPAPSAANQVEAQSPHAYLSGHHRREVPEGSYPQQISLPTRRWLPHHAAVQESGYANADDVHDCRTSTANSLRSSPYWSFDSCFIVRPQLGP